MKLSVVEPGWVAFVCVAFVLPVNVSIDMY